MALERGGLVPKDPHQSKKLEMLKVTAVTHRTKRDQLKRQVEEIKVREACRDINQMCYNLDLSTCSLILVVIQILKDQIKSGLPLDDDGGSAELQRSLLTAWRMQLKDLQRAHHLIGNYVNILVY